MRKEQVILGENCIYSSDCKETGLNNNIIACGGSGSGKTMSLAEPRLLETKNTSLIATLTKRRLANKYIPLFKKRKYKILDLNFVNPMESNCAFDPLQYVEGYADINFIAESIVKSETQKGNTNMDPYWDNAAKLLLCGEMGLTMMTKENATFADVVDLHHSLTIDDSYGLIKTSLDEKFDYIASRDPNCFALTCWKSFKNLPIKTAGCVYGTLSAALDTIFTPELLEMMEKKKKIDFKKISKEKTILFVTTSAVNPALHRFVNMLYAQAFKQLFEFAETRFNGMLPIPVHVLCDDFATGSRVLNFPEYISIFREKGISVTLLLQSESQLEQMYGVDNAITIINNCDSYVYFGGMDLRTAQHVSLRLNAPLDEVLYMPIGQEILFRRGQRPIITSRYEIEKNDLYQQVMKDYEKQVESKIKRTDEIQLYEKGYI